MKAPTNLPPLTYYSNNIITLIHAQISFPVHERHNLLHSTLNGNEAAPIR